MSSAAWAWVILGIVVAVLIVWTILMQIPQMRRYFRMKAM